jgi:hypothetical protein
MIYGSSGVFVGKAICFGTGCCLLVLSEAVLVLVLERSLVGTIISVLRKVNFIPHSIPSSDYDYEHEYEHEFDSF